MATPTETYRQFIGFEENAATIYLRLASRFSADNAELSAFWLEMAIQEKAHAALLQFCVAEGLMDQDVPGDAEIQQIHELFDTLQLRASRKDVVINDAFQIAYEMEGSELDTIYCRLTTLLHPSMYLLKRKIATSPSAHIEGLANAAKKFGASQEIIANLERLSEKSPELFSNASLPPRSATSQGRES